MSDLMTDVEVQEYAQNIVGYIGEDGAISQEGLEYLANNVPSSEDQQRIIQAIKDIKANEDQPQVETTNEGGDAEAEAAGEDEGEKSPSCPA